MKSPFTLFALILVAAAAAATIQIATTPKLGSAERKAIMDSLRVPIERALKKKVMFKVTHLKSSGTWAFMQGQPIQPNGKPIDYRNTQYWEAIQAGAFDDGVLALFKKRNGKWTVVEWSHGATDWPVDSWREQHKAPRTIFPR